MTNALGPPEFGSITDKVSYVKAQPRRGQHFCHWPSCRAQVPAAMWGCKKHWFKLPSELRTKVWEHYRPGQELDKNPSQEYVEVAKEIQKWIEDNVR